MFEIEAMEVESMRREVFSIPVSDETRAFLEQAKAGGSSLDQVLKDALSLLNYVLTETSSGVGFGHLLGEEGFTPVPINLDISPPIPDCGETCQERHSLTIHPEDFLQIQRLAAMVNLSVAQYLEAALNFYQSFHHHQSLNQPFVLRKEGQILEFRLPFSP